MLGVELAVNVFDIIVVDVATAGAFAVIYTAPLAPGLSDCAPAPFPNPGDKVLTIT